MSSSSESGEVNEKVFAAAVPGEWVVRKLLGPLMGEFGEDLKRAYEKGRDKLLGKAASKVSDLEDGWAANMRVVKDVLMSGSITDDEVCAEYFGGVLASSRSESGSDDSAIGYVGAIQSMSSNQLRLHYLLYNELNRLLTESNESVEVGYSADLNKWPIFVSTMQLESQGIDVAVEMVALYRMGIVSEWQAEAHKLNGRQVFPYMRATPTTFGVLLYAVAHNRLSSWKSFAREYFGTFEGVPPIGLSARSIEGLIDAAALGEPAETKADEND